jgi:hypothetical protein
MARMRVRGTDTEPDGGGAPMTEGDFERAMRTTALLNGICPFRGGNWCRLDERCPATVPVVMAAARDSNLLDVLVPVPVLRRATYCQSCVHDWTRETEAGMPVPDKRSARRQ